MTLCVIVPEVANKLPVSQFHYLELSWNGKLYKK